MKTLAIAVLLAASFPLSAQDKEPKQPKINKYLKPVSWLIGTWTSKGNMMGMEYEDKYVYTWALNNNFIKHEYWMYSKGKLMHYDTGMMGWDRDQKKLVGFTFGNDGAIGFGEEVKSEPDKELKTVLVMNGRVIGNMPFKKFQTTLSKIDDDTLHAQMSVWNKKKEAYAPFGGRMTYNRKKKE